MQIPLAKQKSVENVAKITARVKSESVWARFIFSRLFLFPSRLFFTFWSLWRYPESKFEGNSHTFPYLHIEIRVNVTRLPISFFTKFLLWIRLFLCALIFCYAQYNIVYIQISNVVFISLLINSFKCLLLLWIEIDWLKFISYKFIQDQENCIFPRSLNADFRFTLI